MDDKRLKIVSVDGKQENRKMPSSRKTRREETQARMDRLWLEDPEQFDPFRNCIEQERLVRTLDLVDRFIPLKDKKVADLGCGGGELTRMFRDKGASVDALDISSIALKKLKSGDMDHITPFQECLPTTTLPDDGYDLVSSTEVIAYLQSDDYRLYLAEMSRLVKLEGFVVCSTSLDINTEAPLEQFSRLVETEFEIHEWSLGYHLCYIRWCNFWEAPGKFVRAYQNPDYRERQIKKRIGLSRLWFKWNSQLIPSYFWRVVAMATNPLASFFRHNKKLMLWTEKFCHFLWNENGISHAIFIGKRRPLIYPLPPKEIPMERKHKREVWE